MTNKSQSPSPRNYGKTIEVITLNIVSVACLGIGIYHLVHDKPATAATGFVAAILFFALAKLDDFNIIEAAGMIKLERRKRELETTIQVAGKLAERLRKIAIQFEVQQFLKVIPESRPKTDLERMEQRKIFDEFTERFTELECSNVEIQAHFEPWRRKISQCYEAELVALAARKISAFDEKFFGYWELCNHHAINTGHHPTNTTQKYQELHPSSRVNKREITLEEVKIAANELIIFLKSGHPNIENEIAAGVKYFEERQAETIPPLTFPEQWAR